MGRTLATACVLLACVVCVRTPASAATIKYTVAGIGVAAGDTVGFAEGINDLGQVVGFSSNSTDGRFGPRHAFLYSNGQLSTLGIPAGADSQAFAINNLGQIVGQQSSMAFVWNAQQFTSIPLNGAASAAVSINKSGQVTGYYYVDSSSYHAFLYDLNNSTTMDLHPAGWTSSAGTRINNKGQIVGSLFNLSGSHSFLYQNGQVTDLTNSIGLYAATDINDGGEIVGYQSSGTAYYYNGRGLVALGAGPPTFLDEHPYAVNTSGVIVGAFGNISQVHKAFVYSGGTLSDLNTLIDPNSGWNLQLAFDINDEGQIVGQGIDPSGNERGFILDPVVPEPRGQVPALIGFGAVWLLSRRRRAGACRPGRAEGPINHLKHAWQATRAWTTVKLRRNPPATRDVLPTLL